MTKQHPKLGAESYIKASKSMIFITEYLFVVVTSMQLLSVSFSSAVRT